ncbi:MAG: TerB family tellurite resistance protein [Pseudomonadales bacterium]|nr:TerB family tellurite resistance protein [Pseudomonadales bacterium]
MSWMGKMLGGGIGFMVGGPIGAVLGAVLGHHTMDSGNFLNQDEERHGIYFVTTFSMLGKLSKADGQVSPEEIEVVERVMTDSLRLPLQARQFAIKIFNTAKDSRETFEDYARQFYGAFHDHPEVLVSLVDLLLRISHADGVLHPAEDRLIEQAVDIFGIGPEYQQVKARYSNTNDLDKCYATLGAKHGESLKDIKKKYRRLAMEYHPDRVQSNGVTPELALLAEERFKEIQHAFDVVEKHLA